MAEKKSKKKFPSELRMDLVSNDWVIIATGRARRPETFARRKKHKKVASSKDCPFCQESINEKAIAGREKSDGSWFVISIPNDFPAFSKGYDLHERKEGPNRIMDGLGYHEVIITADHQRSLAQFSKKEVKMVVDVYQERYLELMDKKFIKYISIFHNHGREAGASVAHPHSQLIAIPVIDPDLRGSLDGAESFYRSQGKCVYCTMINWDIKDGRRIIYQNEKFVVLCPFAPQISFEVWVYPKEHRPYFEKMSEDEKEFFADALQKALHKIRSGLKDPAYNFYFHTAPCSGGSYDHYHWHLNILPRMNIWAGFELAAGIEISTIEPEKAAAFLRKQ
jgi:UDPglucose--hexose-1-phosphate uridylyltransferase